LIETIFWQHSIKLEKPNRRLDAVRVRNQQQEAVFVVAPLRGVTVDIDKQRKINASLLARGATDQTRAEFGLELIYSSPKRRTRHTDCIGRFGDADPLYRPIITAFLNLPTLGQKILNSNRNSATASV
jgi:hypothetical protein